MNRIISNVWQNYRWCGYKCLHHLKLSRDMFDKNDVSNSNIQRKLAQKYHNYFILLRQIIIEK